MQIGSMNHPGREVLEEIECMATLQFEFIDLTLEPPRARADQVDVARVREALQKFKLGVIGHTAYYLPLGSPFESIRRATIEEFKHCLKVFGDLGVRWMNLHPDRQAPLHDRQFVIERNLQTIRELLELGREHGIGLMIENLPGGFNTADQLGELLDPLPELGLHLDIGHANLQTEGNTTDEILARFGGRLRHVHLHDNKGGTADLHLPLGCGIIDMPHYVRSLQACGYDGTITLEVFTADRHYLSYSRELLREFWDKAKR
jgi:sugar phosphate isomerase/epimerase